MKATVVPQYGSPDVLQVMDVEKPLPKDDEVLVKVHTASLNAYDWHLLTADIFLVRLMGGGFSKPKKSIMGEDIAGRVEAVGKNVQRFRPGDEVFGDISVARNGGIAEYAVTPETLLASKPAELSFESAAAMGMAAVTALQGLRDHAKVQPGQKVLINGAGGGVGTFAVQIARALGAEVTAVCSTRNVENMYSLGAHHVIDYTKEDVTKSGQHFDVILAANGYHSLFDYRRILTPGGIYVMAGGRPAQIFEAVLLAPLVAMGSNQKFMTFTAEPKHEDLEYLCELFAAGKVIPVIDRCYPMSEIANAMRYLGEGHARGKIVIMVAQESQN